MPFKGVLTLLFACFIFQANAQDLNAGAVNAELHDAVASQSPESIHTIVIQLADKVDIRSMDAEFYKNKTSLEDRAYQVITSLEAKAAATQGPILSILKSEPLVDPTSIHAFYINNTIFAKVPGFLIQQLSNHDAVEYMDFDRILETSDFTIEESNMPPVPNGKEPGLAAIKADKLWAKGYTGYGTRAYIIDTGTEPSHGALTFNYHGRISTDALSWSGTDAPTDCDGHGTHVTGTVCGLNRNTNDTIGVAFGATWMAAPPISCDQNTSLSATQSLQWALNPDGNASTIEDMPNVINNSWYSGTAGDECNNGMWINIFNPLEAAGVAVIFAAGNFGPGVSTITSPSNINTDLVNVFSVGNLNGNSNSFPINSSSSRGPSVCGGTNSLLIKPEVSAPGTNVRSSLPNGGFASFTGTSMASPHASGALLLLKEAFPTLTGTELKLAMYFSATDLGATGEDNQYGMGIINLDAAFDYLVNEGNVPVDAANLDDVTILQLDDLLNFHCGSSVDGEIRIQNSGDNNLTSATIHYEFVGGGPSGDILWTGNLAFGEKEYVDFAIPTPAFGEYDLLFTCTLANGQADPRPLNSYIYKTIKVVDIPLVTVAPTVACDNSSVVLFGNHPTNGPIAWFSSATGGDPISYEYLITGPIASQTSYYVDIFTTGAAGKVDIDEGIGGNDTDNNGYLIFDALSPFILKTVDVRAFSSGVRFIEVQDMNGTMIVRKIATLQEGDQTVELNLEVPAGENMRLALGAGDPLYRNFTGASYPYELDDVVSIKGNSNNQFRYYYFYNWQVEFGNPCGRQEIVVDPSTDVHTTDFTPSTTLVDLTGTGEVTFTDNTTGATSWFWDFGDGNTSTMQNPTHTYTDEGDYDVTLVTEGPTGCMDGMTIQITASLNVGINPELDNLGTVLLYPNPSRNIFFLALDLNEQEMVQGKVMDLLGKTVLEIPATKLQSSQLELDLDAFPTGVYYLELQIGNQTKSLKMTKI